MRDRTRLIRREAPHDLPARSHDAHKPVIAAEEQTVGTGADAGNVVTLEDCARIVVGDLDLCCFEEVKGPPLLPIHPRRLVTELAVFGEMEGGWSGGHTVNAMVAS